MDTVRLPHKGCSWGEQFTYVTRTNPRCMFLYKIEFNLDSTNMPVANLMRQINNYIMLL